VRCSWVVSVVVVSWAFTPDIVIVSSSSPSTHHHPISISASSIIIAPYPFWLKFVVPPHGPREAWAYTFCWMAVVAAIVDDIAFASADTVSC